MNENDQIDDLPDRRKHGYAELEKKVDEHAAAIEERLRGFFVKALLAFAVLGLTSAGALLGFGIVLKEQSHTATEIQNQRYQALFETCLQQNNRHDRSIQRAKKILPKRAQPTVILLVNELQPYVQDCDKQARLRVKGETYEK